MIRVEANPEIRLAGGNPPISFIRKTPSRIESAWKQCWTSWQELPTYGYRLVAAADSLLAEGPDHSGSIKPPAGSDFRSQLLLRVTWSLVGGPPENPDRRVTAASPCQPLATSELQKPVAIQRDITAALAAVQHCLEVLPVLTVPSKRSKVEESRPNAFFLPGLPCTRWI